MVKNLEEKEEKYLKNHLETVNPGDLICVEWSDASTGKSSFGSGGSIEVPVHSWGIFIGVLGAKVKHIVLAQNSFSYAEGYFDLDYTAIPLGWATDITTLVKQHIQKEAAVKLVASFLAGRRHALTSPKVPRTFQRHLFQQRLSVNGRPD
jgi:hypothetical protein